MTQNVAASLGIRFQIVPQLPLDDGVNAARLLLPRCWIDEVGRVQGLEALTHYRRSYNERLQEFTAMPVHDWASHAADAFRGLTVRHKVPEDPRPLVLNDPPNCALDEERLHKCRRPLSCA